MLVVALIVNLLVGLATSTPIRRWEYSKYFDLQGHRGGRGETVENTLPSFAMGIINGVTTLEMDCGITKDGAVIVWHDEFIDPTKCEDRANATDDPMYPYIGKYIANLTLAQIKTLDCGSERLQSFPFQELVPETKLSTLAEMFEFVACATDEPILFNIESKVDADFANLTRSPEDFVRLMGEVFEAQGPAILDRITHQSFDWRALVISKQSFPSLRTSALCSDSMLYKPLATGSGGNLTIHGTGPGNWLAGLDIDTFEGETIGERIARAAKSINADFLSPTATAAASGTALDPSYPGWIPFTNQSMVDTAQSLGMPVKPYTPDTKNLLDYLLGLGVDGVITDYPYEFRRHLGRSAGTRSLPAGISRGSRPAWQSTISTLERSARGTERA